LVFHFVELVFALTIADWGYRQMAALQKNRDVFVPVPSPDLRTTSAPRAWRLNETKIRNFSASFRITS
jgi:hypothetical protein